MRLAKDRRRLALIPLGGSFVIFTPVKNRNKGALARYTRFNANCVCELDNKSLGITTYHSGECSRGSSRPVLKSGTDGSPCEHHLYAHMKVNINKYTRMMAPIFMHI